MGCITLYQISADPHSHSTQNQAVINEVHTKDIFSCQIHIFFFKTGFPKVHTVHNFFKSVTIFF